jgi:hypothetical protein
MASMRRTPAEMLPSYTILHTPISPVRLTCVPPHSSRLNPGTETTRTCSPYFSPNSAIAPVAIAWSSAITFVSTGVFLRISSFMSRSTSSSSAWSICA